MPDMTFRTQLDAVDYLKAQGFKLGKSKFNKDFKAGKIPTNADGHFEATALMGYAAANLNPLERVEDKASAQILSQRAQADTELKAVQAERQRLKLQKEQGLLMPRSEYEAALSARALFFKSEIEGFIHRAGGEMIALVGGEESTLPQLVQWWDENTADWMDAWAQDREFGVADEETDPEEEGAEA